MFGYLCGSMHRIAAPKCNDYSAVRPSGISRQEVGIPHFSLYSAREIGQPAVILKNDFLNLTEAVNASIPQQKAEDSIRTMNEADDGELGSRETLMRWNQRTGNEFES